MEIERRVVMSRDVAHRFIEEAAAPDHKLSVFIDPGGAEGLISHMRQRIASRATVRFIDAFDQVHFHCADEGALREIDDAATGMQLETTGVQ